MMKTNGNREAIIEVVAQVILEVKVDELEAGVGETRSEVHHGGQGRVGQGRGVQGQVQG